MSIKEKSLKNSNKYKVLFLKNLMRAPDIYLDVLIIDSDYEKSQIQIIEKKAPREMQEELRSFC